jgi:L-ribulose-5-phosphate 3-epimerase
VKVGMVGRFFPGNWRPPADEIRFAAEAGFDLIQIRSDSPGSIEADLRAPLADVRKALDDAGVEIALEMFIHVDADGRTAGGDTLAAAFARNLEAIDALGCRWVHVHPVRQSGQAAVAEVERLLVPALAEAAVLAAGYGLALGLEHNAPDQLLFARSEACAAVLEAVPQLGFVWDVNHTAPDDFAAFEVLLRRATLVHGSDTPLPETNHHLPIGLGNVDFARVCAVLGAAAFDGPFVLEIGGLPKSGGYGRDTDDALRASRERLLELA